MTQNQKPRSPRRRAFLAGSVAAVGTLGSVGSIEAQEKRASGAAPERPSRRPYNGPYEGETLSRVAFPLGGMGAGMLCLEGTGALSHVSLRHQPNIFNEPCVFAAVCVKGDPNRARVVEGPVPSWKRFGLKDSGNGGGGATWGLPRFGRARFEARFPFGTVTLEDDDVPLKVEITGWSPFEAGDPDSSSLPFAALEYRLTNPTARALTGVFSFNARNFMAAEKGEKAVRPIPGGFVLWAGGTKEKPWEEGSFCVRTDDAEARVNHAWFRGGWFDDLTLAWKDVEEGACYDRPPVSEGPPSPGATVFVPFTLAPGATKAIVVQLSWYVGSSHLRVGDDPEDDEPVGERRYRPWYAKRFSGIEEAAESWRTSYASLREKTARFSDCFHDQTLPPEVVEAVAANLTILKSPTVMRQADGRLWSWEGCGDSWGCCHGSCTHVWNYAQAVPHLFPSLERTLRETEFRVSQDARGHQTFRAALPIRPPVHDFHAAADGQLGGILKVYREWRISGDTAWLRSLWPSVKTSLDYCIETWDPRHTGALEEPHHNTYDIEFWGPDGMCTSFYLGALRAATLMGAALGDPVPAYAELLEKGRRRMETDLWNGEYFVQKVQWKGLRAGTPQDTKSMVGEYSPEARGAAGQGRAQVPVRRRLPLRRRPRRLDGRGVRHGRGPRPREDRQPPARGPPPQLAEGPLRPRQPPAADVRLRRGRRASPLHLAAGRRPGPALRLLERGVDGDRVPGRLAPHADGDGRGGPRDRPHRAATATTAASATPSTSTSAATGTRGPCRRTASSRASPACATTRSSGSSTWSPASRGTSGASSSTATGYGTVGVRSGKPFLEVRSGRIDVERIDYRPLA